MALIYIATQLVASKRRARACAIAHPHPHPGWGQRGRAWLLVD